VDTELNEMMPKLMEELRVVLKEGLNMEDYMEYRAQGSTETVQSSEALELLRGDLYEHGITLNNRMSMMGDEVTRQMDVVTQRMDEMQGNMNILFDNMTFNQKEMDARLNGMGDTDILPDGTTNNNRKHIQSAIQNLHDAVSSVNDKVNKNVSLIKNIQEARRVES